MFEDSLFASQHRVTSPRTRWTTAVSLTLQLSIAGLLILLPMFHVEHLPTRADPLAITLPPPRQPPPPPSTVVERTATAVASIVPVLGRVLAAPRIIPNTIDTYAEPASPGMTALPMNGGSPMGSVLGIGSESPTPTIRVTPAPEHKAGPVHVSSGVSTGLLLAPIRPIYPPIAKAAHVEGVVVVEAVISKAGTIESLHVLSGPVMLQTAALDAIRAARYQPFRLNNEPTEVQTTITVNFRMGG